MPAIPSDIEQLVVTFLRDEVLGDPSADLDVDDNLLTSGIVDSVAVVRLIAHVENTVGVAVPPTDMVPENFRTIRTMAEYLAGLSG